MKPMTNKTLILTIAAVLAFPPTHESQSRRRSGSVNVDSDQVTNCNDVRVTYDRRPAVTAEAEMTLSPGQVSVLRAEAANSGIYVMGWDRAEYSVKTCKAVPDDDSNPTATLGQIMTTNEAGRITVRGPSDHDWMATLILMVPRISSLDLQTANGPLQLKDLAGNIHLNAANGPISLSNVGGSVQATTANGPISVKDSSGDHHLSATNGPIRVALSGTHWDGPGLEASTRNGPLTVGIPDNYGSAVRIETSEHSPISCNSAVCAQAVRSLGSNVIRIGNGDPVVRLSTVNGPLSIQSSKN